ncbi:hypothetical protein FS842_010018 [Serendipita sp. 407]|nr:hypothetical protein FRC15_006808 [Serendipita sp. 397]KAG8833743.1 hypothetical protein FRC18_003129 [Serendipita sp. 400]KAG8872560.1 hypothetical protein FRC20_009411 [Serendipita sp. 405]KAG9056647.1 hypothetical protein FS842_010018 [Serendipita sp. 407]
MFLFGVGGYGRNERSQSRTQPPSQEENEKRASFSTKERLASITRRRASSRAEMHPPQEPSPLEQTSRIRRLFRWIYNLRFRWQRTQAHLFWTDSRAPVIPPINIDDRMFLESLVRHTEENIIHQARASTQALLSGSTQPPVDSCLEFISTPYASPYSEDTCELVSCETAAPPYQLSVEKRPMTAEKESRPSTARSNFVVMRSPHPPSSYQPYQPPDLTHSRQPSHSRSSTATHETSIYGDDTYAFDSFATSILRHRGSPLFYRSIPDSTPVSPMLATPIQPSICSVQRASFRLSTQTVSSSTQHATSRNGSLTVSLRTPDGDEDFEFPSPPRHSGCWFSTRDNNETPQNCYHEEIGSDTDVENAVKELERLSSQNSVASSSSLATPQMIAQPHAHTFGLGTKSILSLNGPGVTAQKKGPRLNPMPSAEDFYGTDEDIESVCSAFAGVSLHNSMIYDAVDDALSDTDSFADPALTRF